MAKKNARYVIKDRPDTSPLVEWESYIDEDGDFLVKANGVLIFWVESESGKLHKCDVGAIEREGLGLALDSHNLIISVN